MPSPNTTGTLQNVGDVVSLSLGNAGVGQPGDSTAIFGLSGGATNAVIAFEAIPLGQPLTQPALAGPFQPPTPQASSEWATITEQAVVSGQLVSSPITYSSSGAPGTAVGFTFGCGADQAVRMRLLSTGGGAIQASIACVPFPVDQGGPRVVTGSVLVSGGPVAAVNQSAVLPALPVANVLGTPLAAVAANVPGDVTEGMQTVDRQLRMDVRQVHLWLRRLFFLTMILFKRTDLSEWEVMDAVMSEMPDNDEDHMDGTAAEVFQGQDVG